MENLIYIKNKYNSLDKLCGFLKTASTFQSTKEYDRWEIRTDKNGHMKKCIVIKKSDMHALKLYFIKDNTVKINHIIPSKMMHAYFGKSVKIRKNIIEIITGSIMQVVLKGSQQKAFEELKTIVKQAT